MNALLRVIPLGGLGEIGKNMTVVEYDGRMIIVDAGVRFPTVEQVGIDLVLPDFSYVLERADQLEAIVITHGHEDHLGALPYLIRKLGGPRKAPPIYGRKLTMEMARSKVDEHRMKELSLTAVKPGQKINTKTFDLEFIHATHSIPDAAHVSIGCELGTVLFTGDYKFDQTPVEGPQADFDRLAQFGRDGCLLVFGDSTNVDRDGWSPSEAAVGPGLQRVFEGCDGRIILTAFASNLHRIQQVIDVADRLDRKVCLIGRSMVRNTRIAQNLGLLNVPEGILVHPKRLGDIPERKLVIVCTGSQGEPLSALRRMAFRDHQHIRLNQNDTVIFSATPIPGNERAVNETVDSIHQAGAKVVTSKDEPIHASGHGYAEEVKLMLNLTRPKYVMPAHGDFHRLQLHKRLAESVGIPGENVFCGSNGLPLEIDQRGARFGAPVQSGVLYVDGVDIGEPADSALRDRRSLSADGLFVVVATIDDGTGESAAEPELIFRGVPFQDQADQLLDEISERVEKCLAAAAADDIRDLDEIQHKLHDEVAKLVWEKLKRRPMILPVVVSV